MKRKVTVGIIVAIVLSLGLFGSVLAHAELVSSDPAAGTKLTAVPAKVTLVFSEEVDEQGSSFTVTDEKGTKVGAGTLDLNDLDHKTLSGALNSGLGDAVYTVSWVVITSDDQAKEEGTFTFGVNKDPGAQPTAAPEEEETAGPTAAPTTSPAATTTPQPTTQAGGATQPTATAVPANLPRTGDGGSSGLLSIVLGAIVVLVGGVALSTIKAPSRS